jgi:hypothetical protein
MTAGEDLEQALTVLRWSYRAVAAQLRCDAKLVRKWATGELQTPEPVADWLADCARRVARINLPPPPADWRTKSRQRRRTK